MALQNVATPAQRQPPVQEFTDVFAKAGVARLPILALEGTIRCFLSLPLLLIDRLDVPVMLVDRLDVPVIGASF